MDGSLLLLYFRTDDKNCHGTYITKSRWSFEFTLFNSNARLLKKNLSAGGCAPLGMDYPCAKESCGSMHLEQLMMMRNYKPNRTKKRRPSNIKSRLINSSLSTTRVAETSFQGA